MPFELVAIARRAWFALVLGTSLLLSGCAGIPLSAMARLARFDPDSLLTMDPAVLFVAINADARAQSIEKSPTTFELKITPREPAQWVAVERSLPMRLLPMQAEYHLGPALPGRRWLLYGFDTQAAAQLREVQQQFRELKAQKQGNGGSIAFGIGQAWLAQHYPLLRDTQVETWLRLDRDQGFFKLWGGHVHDLEQTKSK